MLQNFISQLQKYFENPNHSGVESQKLMIPTFRSEIVIPVYSQEKRFGAVMLLLYLVDNEIFTVFIERTDDKSVHSKQIALPGGKFENTDKNLIFTAFRETKEEIGVEIPENHFIATLTPLFIPVSNIEVLPVISFLNVSPNFILNKKEVEKVIEMPLKKLFSQENKGVTNFFVRGINVIAPFYNAKTDKIWGATAMILSEFEVIKKKMNFFL